MAGSTCKIVCEWSFRDELNDSTSPLSLSNSRIAHAMRRVSLAYGFSAEEFYQQAAFTEVDTRFRGTLPTARS